MTVAAVHGMCLAGGAQLAASCDLVLVQAESARFMLPGTLGGGFCHTPAVAISSRVAPRRAFELAALAEEVDAAEAHHIGLANRIIPQVARVAATKLPTSLVEPPWARTSSRHLLAPPHSHAPRMRHACATHARSPPRCTQPVGRLTAQAEWRGANPDPDLCPDPDA